jgi:hypothetical protein
LKHNFLHGTNCHGLIVQNKGEVIASYNIIQASKESGVELFQAVIYANNNVIQYNNRNGIFSKNPDSIEGHIMQNLFLENKSGSFSLALKKVADSKSRASVNVK